MPAACLRRLWQTNIIHNLNDIARNVLPAFNYIFGRLSCATLQYRPSFQVRETLPKALRSNSGDFTAACPSKDLLQHYFSYVLTTSSYNFFFGTIITTPYQRVSGFQLFFPVFSLGWDRLTVFLERMTLFSYGTYLLLSRLRVCTLYTLITFIFMYCSF